MSNTICWFSSDDIGAPTLNNSVGSTIAVLDACLIDGYGLKSVTSITVASSVATVTCSTHSFGGGTGRLVLIAGASPAELNGRKLVTNTGPNTFTFDATGIADQTASGTITAKRAPLDWVKAHAATGKAIYQRSDPAATAMLLRVEDTNTAPASATDARLLMLESATDIDTYGAYGPLSTQAAGGGMLFKGADTAAAKKWVLVGDSRTIYLYTENSSYTFASYGSLFGHCFGDIDDYVPSGVNGCYLFGAQGSFDSYFGASDPANDYRGGVLARNAAGSGGAVIATNSIPGYSTSFAMGGVTSPPYPSPVDGGLVVSPQVFVREKPVTGNAPIRGKLRGVAAPTANIQGTLHGTVMSGFVGSSREFLFLGTHGGGTSMHGCLMFDLTGPW